MKIALIGGNPKGFDKPFHPETLSGKRLRKILSNLNLKVKLVDMTANRNDIPSVKEVSRLQEELKGYTIVFLGHFVEAQLKQHFPNGIYLPHPASRRKKDLQRLEEGLRQLSVK